jgi:uncharacterized protein with PQ loop repeat
MLIFGWIGGGLSVVYNIPQIYHTYKNKSVGDISIYSLLVRIISYLFYILHGYLIMDPPILFMTLASLLQVLIICVQYFIYKDTIINN